MKHILFLIFFLVLAFVSGLLVSKVPVFNFNADDLSKYGGLREYYSDFLWQGMYAQSGYYERLGTIRKILHVNPSYEKAYYELCNNLSSYSSADRR